MHALPIARRLRRILTLVGRVLVVVAGIVLLLVVLVLLPPVRGRLLETLIARLTTTLPGELSVGSAHWPAPGRLDVADVLWADGGDTLLAFSRGEVVVVLRPLLARDLHVRELNLQGLRVDWPALQKRLPGGAARTGESRWRGSFPRAGALAVVPSLAASPPWGSTP
jgi:hypothetical protein